MPDSNSEYLAHSALKATVLEMVATEDLDQIPPEFDEIGRFIVCAVRAVARRSYTDGLTVFIYSEAPASDGKQHGFNRVMHMQDGLGATRNMAILTSQDANNGCCRSCDGLSLEAIVDSLEQLSFDGRLIVIWDCAARTATVYPEGTRHDQNFIRFLVPVSHSDLTQDEVCEVLNRTYDDNLKNPSGRTAKLWSKGKLIERAEDEIERHLRGQIAMFFAGQSRPVQVLSQTNTTAGRTDLIFLQHSPSGSHLSGVLELKVLRGPPSADWDGTKEGLSQGYYYREDLHLPFATLALYDVNQPPSDAVEPVLENQDPLHLAAVRVRRFPIFNSPKGWRDAGGPELS